MRYADNCCTYEELFNPHRYVFTGLCIVTKKKISVTVPAEELHAYRKGKLIQDAMPSLSADDREFLMSGISGEGWKQTFTEEEEENDTLDMTNKIAASEFTVEVAKKFDEILTAIGNADGSVEIVACVLLAIQLVAMERKDNE